MEWRRAIMPNRRSGRGADGRDLPRHQREYTLSLVRSPDMRLVALVVSMSAASIACGGSTPFAKGEDCLRTFSGHSDHVCAVALGPSGKQMVSGGADGKIKFWDVESGQCRRTLDGHTEWVQSVALSSDGRSLASGGRDDLVKLWDVESGELRKTFVGHSGIVTSVTYSRDGRFLASCGRDKSIKIWDIASARCSKTLGSGDFFTSSAVLFTRDRRQLLFGGDSLQLWDVDSGKRLRDFKGHTDSVGAIAISGNGKWFVSAGSYEDKTIRLWEAESGNCLWKKDCAKIGGGRVVADLRLQRRRPCQRALRRFDQVLGCEIGCSVGHGQDARGSCLFPFHGCQGSVLRIW